MIFGREKGKHQNSEKSIVTQTAFRVSVVFICALILLTALFTIYIVRYMKNNILEEKKKQTETIAETVNNNIESLTTPIISLSSYTPVIRLLNDYDDKYSKEWMQNIRNIDNYLLNVNLFYDDVIDILLVQPDSRIVYSMSDRMKVEYDYTGQVWFQKALEQDSAIKYAYHSRGDFFYQAGEADTLSAIYPVSRADTRIGYILYEYDLSKIADFFKEPEGSDSGYILIDDMGNQILA